MDLLRNKSVSNDTASFSDMKKHSGPTLVVISLFGESILFWQFIGKGSTLILHHG